MLGNDDDDDADDAEASSQNYLAFSGLEIEDGWWLTTSASFVKNSTEQDFLLLKCPIDGSCRGGVCTEGYTGPVCTVCENDFGRLVDNCIRCNGTAVNAFLFLLFLGLIGIVTFIVVRFNIGPTAGKNNLIKIAVNHAQMMGFVGAFTVDFPNLLMRFFNLGAQAGGTFLEMSGEHVVLDCLFGMSFYRRMTLLYVFPLVVVAMTLIFVFIAYRRSLARNSKRPSEQQKEVSFIKKRYRIVFFQSVLVVLYFLHPIFAEGVLNAYKCVSVGKRRFLESDMSVDCDSNSYKGFLAFNTTFLVFYVLGALVGIAVFLVHLRRHLVDEDSEWRNILGFLTRGFHPHQFYWDIWITFRKILVVSMAVFFAPALQVFCFCWLMAVSWYLQDRICPWKSVHEEFYDSLSALVLFTTSMCGILFYTGTLKPDSDLEAFVSVMIILLNVGLMSRIMYIFLIIHLEENGHLKRLPPTMQKYFGGTLHMYGGIFTMDSHRYSTAGHRRSSTPARDDIDNTATSGKHSGVTEMPDLGQANSD